MTLVSTELVAPQAWLDRAEWPFAPRWLSIEGHRLHAVDEGAGRGGPAGSRPPPPDPARSAHADWAAEADEPATDAASTPNGSRPLVLVHGTPSWSWEWRHVIRALAPERRCIAIDHLGFGLSDHPVEADYRPADHARRLGLALDALGVGEVDLVVHDFGAAIGFGWAVAHPERVRSLTVLNGFAWSLRGTSAWWFGRIAATPLGRLLYLRLNASPRWIAPGAWGDRAKLTDAIQRHYVGPFPTPDTRVGPWTLARELAGSDDWYAAIWAERERLAEVPTLLVWGMADPAFGPAYLDRWQAGFPRATVHEIATAGHFPQEEAPDEVVDALRGHLAA